MRRFLKDLATYLAGLTSAAIKGWNDFFFSPADPTPVGLMRIAAGLLAFWSLFVFGLDLNDYFGSTGWAEPGVIRALGRPLSWSFWFLVPDGWLRAVWCGCLVDSGSFHARGVQPDHGHSLVGDRGFDRPSGADCLVRVRPGSFGLAAVSGGDGFERRGGVS